MQIPGAEDYVSDAKLTSMPNSECELVDDGRRRIPDDGEDQILLKTEGNLFPGERFLGN